MEPNALVVAIDNTKTRLATHMPAEKQEEMSRKLDLTFQEHFAFQDAQAAAHAGGRISLDVANTLYTALGGTHTVFNAQPLEVKIVVTQFMALLTRPR